MDAFCSILINSRYAGPGVQDPAAQVCETSVFTSHTPQLSLAKQLSSRYFYAAIVLPYLTLYAYPDRVLLCAVFP